ncbi:GNAT family N-acetyltransferase [Phytohabitans aurantiacus]|uniref:GNAT family N-acetyltransferase n=2 Tax=Phytohabitans aurantiacus TaxID=3016789 RepID=A0ABQ5QZQ8_9ACTN|nr:GNAT family N-acetyltransferase [Phytohabitans aurantiacus]
MTSMALTGCDALAADGGIVHIRATTRDDVAALARLYADASPESLRLRFFATPSRSVIASEVERLVRAPGPEHGAMVAQVAGDVVGVASYERATEDDLRAEFAVFVAGPHRGRGIGTLLLEHLAAHARQHGIVELTGEVLPGNFRMLRVAKDLTGRTRTRLMDGVVDVDVATTTDETALLAADARDRAAERAALRPLLAPRSVAVVGAGRRPGGIGHETLRALVEGGFTGPIYPVNPGADAIAGLRAWPSLAQVPAPVDLVVVAVPGDAVREVLVEAGRAGARAAVILSSGFGESGTGGRAAQAELVRIARAHGIRLVGPNCLGIVNTAPDVRLNACFAPTASPPGGLGVASQSGAVGIALLAQAARTGCGISTFVSLGNKADISGNDLLAYWYDDPATRAVALYLESFGNPRKFARLVRALGRRKPVLAVKSGRSAAGQRAGASHTAAAAAPDVAVDALFAQAGVVRVDNLGELLDTARLLTEQPLPAGDRLAIVGNAGGVNVLAADAAEAAGLRVPAPSQQLRERLARAAAGAAALDNPLDLGAGATPAAFAATVEAVAASGEADAVLLVVAATRANDVPAVLAQVTPVLDRHEALTATVVVIGTSDSPAALGVRRVPVYDLPERAVRALAHAAGYARWRRSPLGARPTLSDVDSVGARAVVHAALAGGGGWQPYPRIADILGRYGIPVLASVEAASAGAAVEAASTMGYPVVLKAADPALVHKSDIGAVHIGLDEPAAVRSAYRAIAAAVGKPDPRVLVQPQAVGQVELVAGIVHDPLFGSLVMLGLGGVYTDLLGDRAFRLVPMTDLDAGRMWRSLRAAPLLTGYRGAPPADTAAVEDLVLRLGRLAEDLPEIAELDLNPVMVGSDGAVAVDAKLRLAPAGIEPDATLRGLRQPE